MPQKCSAAAATTATKTWSQYKLFANGINYFWKCYFWPMAMAYFRARFFSVLVFFVIQKFDMFDAMRCACVCCVVWVWNGMHFDAHILCKTKAIKCEQNETLGRSSLSMYIEAINITASTNIHLTIITDHWSDINFIISSILFNLVGAVSN